jgi:hypothetical protein
MSHITKRESSIIDPTGNLIKKACKAMGAKYLGIGKAELYSGSATGHRIELPDWRYPVVINETTGEITFDNYKGHWGDEKLLGQLKQQYGVAAVTAKAEAEHREYEVATLEDGSIACTVSLGGASGMTTAEGTTSGWDV